MVTPIINQPRRTRRALESTRSPVVLDLETTGLSRHDDIVSVGLLIDNQPYINFLFTRFIPVISRERLRHALEPLATREDPISSATTSASTWASSTGRGSRWPAPPTTRSFF